MLNSPISRHTLLALSLMISMPAFCAVSAEQAAQLDQQLTPMGAERAGNTDGSIPAWDGGYKPSTSGGALVDPYAAEQPLQRIDSGNMAQFAQWLSPGTQAMLRQYPQSFHLQLYPSHRSAAYPESILKQSRQNATRIRLNASGSGLEGGYTSGVPFPVPLRAEEVIWNHVTRYRGGAVKREVHRMPVQTSGAYQASLIRQTQVFASNVRDNTPDSNLLFYFIGQTLAPARQAGNIALIHEPLDQVQTPRQAWAYNAGQRRVRRAPTLAYDSPQNSSDGLATSDNMDMYNGAFDRYDWTLKGKRELLIPYNNYRLHDKGLKYAQIIQPAHLNSDYVRYERHRVWEVEGKLKAGQRHIYDKRTFFIDEDTWQIALADHYDARGELWRVSAAYQLNFYNDLVPWMTAEAIHDLQSRRYLVSGLSNETPSEASFGHEALRLDFKPDALRRLGGKN